MGLVNILSARSKAQPKRDVEILCDIDAIVAKAVGFNLRGKTHVIKPITTETWFKFVDAYQGFLSAQKAGRVSQEEMTQKVYSLFKSVCETITIEEVRSMELPEVLGLFAFIVDTIQGKTQGKYHWDEAKKKT